MSNVLRLSDGQSDPDKNRAAAPNLDVSAIDDSDDSVVVSAPDAFLTENALVEEEQTSTAEFDRWGTADRKAAKDQRIGTENAFHEAVNQVVNGINIINNYAGSAPAALQNSSAPVRADQIVENRGMYVEPLQKHAQAVSLLATKRLVILVGDQHMGKQTAALKLLIARFGNDQIFAVRPNIDFDDNQALMIKPQSCYLIGSLEPILLGKLNGFVLQDLTGELEAFDSYLAITVNSRDALDHDAIAEYIMDWNVLPPAEQVLQKHLAWYLQTEILPEAELKLCERPEVTRALAKASLV